MYLIDTDVLSALRRKDRFPRVVKWLANQRTADLYISVVTVGEIEKGIARQRQSDPEFALRLAEWLDSLIELYGDHILGIDLAVARRWGELSARIGTQSADLLLAATALEHGLAVVTRNTRHFQPTGVESIDPSA